MPQEGRSKVEFGVALAVFALLAAAGILLASAVVEDFSKARASRDWKPVDGVVLSKDEERASIIRYAYVAGGRGHESRRVRFFSGLLYPAPTASLRPGESVPVYVDPDDPETAVLMPGGSGTLFALAALGAGALVFIGLGGIIRTLMIAWKQRALNLPSAP
jgi:hypothetical protein